MDADLRDLVSSPEVMRPPARGRSRVSAYTAKSGRTGAHSRAWRKEFSMLRRPARAARPNAGAAPRA
jgi:hypothetical protein